MVLHMLQKKKKLDAKKKAKLDASHILGHLLYSCFIISYFHSSTQCINTPENKTYNADVTKLVRRGHSVIVKQAGCGHPARICVIGKDD